jgi:hypothetical protein
MPKLRLNKQTFCSPLGILIWYGFLSFMVITGMCVILPPAPVPLEIFSIPWHFIQGALRFIRLFPALCLSALVIPWGLKDNPDEPFTRFSPAFLEKLKGPVITAVIAAALYGLLFFLVFPLVKNRENSFISQGRLFKEAEKKAQNFAAAGKWAEAERFILLCDRIWPDNPQGESLKKEVSIALHKSRFDEAEGRQAAPPRPGERYWGGSPDRRVPVNAQEALEFGEQAFREERYYDAHWLAMLALRLAREGSVEKTRNAPELAGRAWAAVASLEPNAQESQQYRLYQLKNTGYEAMLSGDWIRGYYIFQALYQETPQDPDVVNFLGACTQQVEAIAFFADEWDLSLGAVYAGALFSLPLASPSGGPGGRLVLRLDSLEAGEDASYGRNAQALAFGEDGALQSRMETPYVKILPQNLGDRPRVAFLLQSLDRQDSGRRWEPRWAIEPDGLGGRSTAGGDTQIIIDISYDDFLLMAQTRRGLDVFLIQDLFRAERILESFGYIPQVFQAELISRIAEPLLLLPGMILVIVAGWRFRAKRRSRFLIYPMFIILPAVFAGLLQLYRAGLTLLGIWMAATLSGILSLALLIAGVLVCFILSLLILAAQKG